VIAGKNPIRDQIRISATISIMMLEGKGVTSKSWEKGKDRKIQFVKRAFGMPLTMHMNGDQEGRARKIVAVLLGLVAPVLPSALCAVVI
jgi:hypothetical protein